MEYPSGYPPRPPSWAFPPISVTIYWVLTAHQPMTHWRKDTKQTSYDLSHQEPQCLGRKDQSHSSLKHFVDTYFMLGNVLSGEISDMVFALTDYRLETSWKEQLAMRPHTSTTDWLLPYRPTWLDCLWMPNSAKSPWSLVFRYLRGQWPFPYSFHNPELSSKCYFSQWSFKDGEVKDLQGFRKKL